MLNGNTIASVYNNLHGALNPLTDFAVNGSFINFSSAYLDGLAAGSYELTVSFHPLGKEMDAAALADPVNDAPPAPVTIVLNISRAAQQALSITGVPSPVVFGGNALLSTTGGSGTGAVTFASSTPNVISITPQGEITGNNVGTATITATKAGDFDYNEITSTAQITVSPRDILDAQINITGATVYTGSQLRPAFDVTDTAAITNADYDIVWGTNINAGTGSITLNGKGNYTGTLIRNFAISKAAAPTSPTRLLEFNVGASASALTETISLDGLRPIITGEFGTMVYTVTSITDTFGILNAPPNIGAEVLSSLPITVNQTAAANQTATIVITASSTNFENFTITLNKW
jgi:hypothetical protein